MRLAGSRVEHIDHDVARDRRRGLRAGVAVLDHQRQRVDRRVIGRVGDEQRVRAELPGEVVGLVAVLALLAGDVADLHGAGLAGHLHVGQRQLRQGRGAARLVHHRIHAVIIQTEVQNFVSRTEEGPASPINLVVRIAFNPNVETSWFTSVMGIINNITMLAIVLAGAAVIREREHGTMDHLLAMPLTPFEIAISKIWANGLVIIVAVGLSLYLVLQGMLRVPIAGSIPLFLTGTAAYLFFATAIGIFLGTIARSMPQLGLLFLLVYLPLAMLSGSNTPLESMPHWLATIMQISPTVHFVSFAQAILYRGAGFDAVWGDFMFVALMGGIFLWLALMRFRRVAAVQ